MLAPKGLAPAMPVIALIAAWTARPSPGLVLRAALPALPLLAVAALSSLWSITPAASATRAGLLGVEVLAAALLGASLPTPALAPVAGSIAFAAALTLGELVAGGPLTRTLRGIPPLIVPAALSNGMTVAVLLMPACLAALWRARLRAPAVGLLVLVATAALAGRQLAAQIGLAGAVCGGLAALLLPHAIRVAAGLAACLIAGIPLLLPIPMAAACRAAGLKFSITHRVHIWNFAEAMRAERPWTGWGLESARAIPGGRAMADLWTPCGLPLPGPAYMPTTELLPLHTHNAAIQIWLELGPAGALAACALVVGLALMARARDPAGRAGQAGTLIGAVLIALVSYGAWQGWWVATLALAAAVAGALNPASGRHPRPPSGP